MSDNESANTNVAYTSLPHDEATATESLLHESRNGARASGLPKLQMLAYAGIRSSERKYCTFGRPERDSGPDR